MTFEMHLCRRLTLEVVPELRADRQVVITSTQTTRTRSTPNTPATIPPVVVSQSNVLVWNLPG